MSGEAGSTATQHAAEVPNGGWDSRVRVFRAGDEVDTFALVTQRYLILIDTMSTPELSAEVVALLASEREGRQLLVINTHADYDHCWGNATFATPSSAYPAPIIAHERCLARMRSAAARASLERRQKADSRFASVRLVEPTITFDKRLHIEGGDLTLECFPTPGHTEDHIALWVPELRLIFAGDAAEHPFPHVDNGETLPILLRSLEHIAAYDPAVVLPCHGGTITPNLPARNVAYFATVERLTRAALAGGRVPPEAAGWTEPDDQADIERLPELIDFSYEKALRQCGADVDSTPAFYRDFHQDAIKSTIGYVLHHSEPRV
ncbi:MAG: MBL fold metallo-hydrolase [Ktedonobacterales bacterium]